MCSHLAVCVSRRRPPTCLWPDGSPKFVTIVLSVHHVVALGIVEVTVLQKANQTQPLKNQKLYFEDEAFLIKRFWFSHIFVVLWFGPSTFQNLAIHVSTVRCQYEESSCHASVPTSPRNLEWFSVHQIVDPGIVEITLFQKANQTQPLHNSTLKMKHFFSISYQNVFFSTCTLSWFRGFVVCGLVCPSFEIWPSTYRSYVVSKKNCPCICPLKHTLSVRITIREHALWSCSSSKRFLPFLPLKVRAHNYTSKK